MPLKSNFELRSTETYLPSKIINAISVTLGIEERCIFASTVSSDIPEWTAIGHLRLITTLEAILALKLDRPAALAAKSVKGLFDLILGTHSNRPQSLIIMRTNRYDIDIQNSADRLISENVIVCLCINFDQKILNIPGRFYVVDHTVEAIKSMTLYARCTNIFWRCGDYAFYNVYSNLPFFNFYWIIEPDIYLNMQNPSNIFRFFSNYVDVDFFSLLLSIATPEWGLNYHAMRQFSEVVVRCSYSFMALSNRAVRLLMNKRIELSQRFLILEDSDLVNESLWPNDESFTATTLKNENYIIRDINSYNKVFYTSHSLYEGPFSPNRFIRNGPDNLIYHHVFRGGEFVARAHAALAWERTVMTPSTLKERFTDHEFIMDFEFESSLGELDDFLRSLDSDIQSA